MELTDQGGVGEVKRGLSGGGEGAAPIANQLPPIGRFYVTSLLPCWRTITNNKYTTISVFVCLLACLSCFCVVGNRVNWEGLLSRGGRRLQVLLYFPTVLLITNSKSVSNNGKWFEPRSISCLSSVIVWVRPVVFRKLIVVEKIEILLNALVVVGD